MWSVKYALCFSHVLLLILKLTDAVEIQKEEVDKVIEDEITQKLTEDLLQSLERKFQVDLEKSVDMVLVKIKLLLQNGTSLIQEKVSELQDMIDVIREHGEKELEDCLHQKHNETSSLAEKALHQMVVCGYALIGHDPAQAISSVILLKDMIRDRLKPVADQKTEIYNLLKACGHEHDTLKKVIKCVISKSPVIKTAMMDTTGKLMDGIVELTKQMAHGAMHEACLIEVIRTVEDEAFRLIGDVRNCVYGNNTFNEELNNYIEENNATVLEVGKKEHKGNLTEVKEMQNLIRRMLAEGKDKGLDKTFKKNLLRLQKELATANGKIK